MPRRQFSVTWVSSSRGVGSLEQPSFANASLPMVGCLPARENRWSSGHAPRLRRVNDPNAPYFAKHLTTPKPGADAVR